MDNVVLISGWQMHAKSGAQADKGKQRGGPSAVKTREQRQAAKQMDRYRDPDRDIRRRHVNAGEISRRAAWIAQLDDAVPDEQAGHQQSCEEQQKGFAAHLAAPFRIRAIWMSLIGTLEGMDHLTNAPHGRSAPSRTQPRNRRLSGAELQVRIHSPPAKSHA